MAKMTKAQAKRRLIEAQKKIDAVAFGDVARHMTTAQRNELYGMSNKLIRVINKL
jgi:hypothetical protein